ncbi:MAG: lysylphosphatidylglycerol synthase transmembrane domain-containing protein [Candidatus Gastranaerophilales bacterium]|nr:lysylphosphatidylglycerol synthase transmembrane domain-containing protein [Candidatus Gastranaerophilales bacterium]
MSRILKVFNKKTFGLLISIIFIVLIFRQVNVVKTLQAFENINFNYLVWVIPVYYLAFLLRAYRWRTLLSDNRRFEISTLISTLFIGYSANCLLPARMGDFYRAHLFGKKENISRIKVFASIVLERIFDGIILVSILSLMILLFYSKPWLYNLAYAGCFVFVGGFITLLCFAKFEKSDKFNDNFLIKIMQKCFNNLPLSLKTGLNKIFNKTSSFFSSFVSGLKVFHSFSLLFSAFFITLIIWVLEALVMFLVISSFGIHIPLVSSLFVLGVIVLSTMIPSGPASVGPYQYGYILALSVFGVAKETALAVSILNQFSNIILILIAGLYFIWKDHINIRQLEKDIEYEEGVEESCSPQTL